MSNNDLIKRAFEVWSKTEGGYDLEPDENYDYLMHETRIAWEGWQAACSYMSTQCTNPASNVQYVPYKEAIQAIESQAPNAENK